MDSSIFYFTTNIGKSLSEGNLSTLSKLIMERNEIMILHDDISNFLYNVTNNIKLNIVKLTFGYSLLYFTNENNIKINIPSNIIVYEYGDNKTIYKIILNKINNEFFHLFCDNNYKIEYNNNLILDIKSKSLSKILKK
jgi:hypothetical protein